MRLDQIIKAAADGFQTPEALTDCFDPMQQTYSGEIMDTMEAIGEIAVRELEASYCDEMEGHADCEQLEDAETTLRGVAKHFNDMADEMVSKRAVLYGQGHPFTKHRSDQVSR